MATKANRATRIAEQIHHTLVEIFAGELLDPRLQEVSVTGVELSVDLKNAVVLVTIEDGEEPEEEVFRALKHAGGYLRSELAQSLQLRHVPQLRFELDRGARNTERVKKLLERLHRRSRKSSTTLAILLCWIGLSAAAGADEPPPERYEASLSAMGTTYTVVAYGEQRGYLASAVLASFEESQRIDSLLSNYKPDSELSLINREGAKGPVKISAEMTRLLEACLDYSRATEGGFDPTVGPLMRVWGFFRNSGEMPSDREIGRAKRRVGYRLIDLDTDKRTVRFLRPGVEIDSGGFGKGYAVDRMAEVLRQAELTDFLISAGSSSLYAAGAPPGESRGWPVRIRHPRDPESTAAKLYLNNESLSTSGSYEKFFRWKGKVYSHLMDPRSGRPVEGMESVSVVAPRTLDSEVWATALFVNGPQWAETNTPHPLRVFLCEQGPRCRWALAASSSN